jgi:hypothetical protein
VKKCMATALFCTCFVSSAVAQSDEVRPIELILNDPVFDGVTTPPWLIAAGILAGLVVVVVAVLAIAWARGARLSDGERAFLILSRRLGVGKEVREVLGQAASCYGCAPVALLISERALREAVLAYQGTPQGRARPAQIERVQQRLLAT